MAGRGEVWSVVTAPSGSSTTQMTRWNNPILKAWMISLLIYLTHLDEFYFFEPVCFLFMFCQYCGNTTLLHCDVVTTRPLSLNQCFHTHFIGWVLTYISKHPKRKVPIIHAFVHVWLYIGALN